MTIPILFIAGPTAIGKSNFAIKIAKKFDGEIINADSMQVYSELKILTARPSLDDMKNIPHHMYGYVNGSKRYNVAIWCEDISKIIKNNLKKNKISIVVGGTGLYIEKLLHGLANIPHISEKVKKESNDYLLKIGKKNFYNEVLKIDSAACKKISENDTQRLKRIWEVFYITKKPLSFWISKKHHNFIKGINYRIFLFTPKRNQIYESVNKRFYQMVDDGCIEEVKNLIKKNYDKSLPIMRAHGVPEISKFLLKKIDLDECIKKSQQVTRNYVKRQLTWWKHSNLDISSNFDDFPGNIDLNLINI